MKRLIPLVVAVAFMVGATLANAGEQLDLAAPINISAYRVIGLNLDWEGATIVIHLRAVTTGKSSTFIYTGATATSLMTALNKANLSTNSLQKRILEKLVTDGKLTGTVSGSPD